MLFLLAEWLGFEGVLNLVRYQTFRAGAALMTARFKGNLIKDDARRERFRPAFSRQ